MLCTRVSVSLRRSTLIAEKFWSYTCVPPYVRTEKAPACFDTSSPPNENCRTCVRLVCNGVPFCLDSPKNEMAPNTRLLSPNLLSVLIEMTECRELAGESIGPRSEGETRT